MKYLLIALMFPVVGYCQKSTFMDSVEFKNIKIRGNDTLVRKIWDFQMDDNFYLSLMTEPKALEKEKPLMKLGKAKKFGSFGAEEYKIIGGERKWRAVYYWNPYKTDYYTLFMHTKWYTTNP